MDEDSVDEDAVGEGIGIRAKRCFSLVWTMDWSSGNVTLRDERRFHDSYDVKSASSFSYVKKGLYPENAVPKTPQDKLEQKRAYQISSVRIPVLIQLQPFLCSSMP